MQVFDNPSTSKAIRSRMPYSHASHRRSHVLAVRRCANHLLQLLLGSELVCVAALALAAVDSSGWEAGVALSADHLVLYGC